MNPNASDHTEILGALFVAVVVVAVFIALRYSGDNTAYEEKLLRCYEDSQCELEYNELDELRIYLDADRS